MRSRVLVAAAAAVAVGCSAHAATPRPAPIAVRPAAAPVAAHPKPPKLVAWHGPVEELFFHPLVLQPRLAFTPDATGLGFEEYFVTAHEMQRILDQLWANGWTLVDATRAAHGDVRVPVGRKPLVLSEDDVNYYRYFDGRGLADRLVLDPQGQVRAEVRDARGRHLTDQDVVPMVDAEAARHPDFSADGAKGVLAVTGYEGLFGEHDLSTPAARERVKRLAAALRATGWTIASHTWGHISLDQVSMGWIEDDTRRWKEETRGLLGPVHILVYPFGGRPSPAAASYLVSQGYPIQLDIDVTARTYRLGTAIVMSRRHIDGFAFQVPGREAPFFSVAQVIDPHRPALR